MSPADLLLDVLRLARDEGALEGEGLTAFSRALEERARLILGERLLAVEEENAWRREAMAGLEASVRSLEKENAWRGQAMTGLEENVRSLTGESAWRREAMASLEQSVRALEAEIEGLRAEHRESSQAHDRLLTHHRDVLGRIVAELMATSAVRFPGLRGVRQKLAALADLLRRETQ